MKTSKLFPLLLTTLLLLSIGISAEQPTNHVNTNQLPPQVQVPQVEIVDVQLSNDLPEENETVSLELVIHNDDNLDYSQFDLVVVVTEVMDFGGPGLDSQPVTEVVANNSVSIITPGNNSQAVDAAFMGGTYTLTAYLLFDGSQLPGSEYSLTIEVLGPPIGDDQTIALALVGITVFVFFLSFIPSIVDVFRRKNGGRY